MISGQITTRRGRSAAHTTAFTLIELLVVVAVAAILMAILAVALHRGMGSAKRAGAESLLSSIGMGMTSFKTDIGYYPPLVTPQLLGTGRQGIVTPETYFTSGASGAASVNELLSRSDVRYHSEFTIASYLLGIGDFNGDTNLGLNPAAAPNTDDWKDDGQAGLGLKAPGRSRAWKDGVGGHTPVSSGRSFGPYLDTATIGGDPKNSKILELDEDTGLYRILDPWGNPVRFYANWPTVDTIVNPAARRPDLSRVPMPLRSLPSILREIDVRAEGTEPIPGAHPDVIDLDRELLNAEYALVCAGDVASEWVMANRYRPGNPMEPVAPFGDLVGSGDLNSMEVPDSAAFASMPPAYQEYLERMLASNVRYTP